MNAGPIAGTAVMSPTSPGLNSTGSPMRRPVCVVAALACLLLVAGLGCGTAHVKRTGALPCYARLTSRPPLSRAYFAPGHLLADYPVLQFEGVGVRGNVPAKGEAHDQYCQALAHQIRTDLASIKKFHVITDAPGDAKAAALSVWITHLDTGSGTLRYLVGFEAGSVDVQIEGKLVDVQTGELVMEFADRRRESGEPNLGLNPTVVKADALIERTLRAQGRALVTVLRDRW